jgi:hypothetical protein
MTSRLIGARSALAVLVASLCAALAGSVRAQGTRRRDRGAAGVGQAALSQELLAVPRRTGGR